MSTFALNLMMCFLRAKGDAWGCRTECSECYATYPMQSVYCVAYITLVIRKWNLLLLRIAHVPRQTTSLDGRAFEGALLSLLLAARTERVLARWVDCRSLQQQLRFRWHLKALTERFVCPSVASATDGALQSGTQNTRVTHRNGNTERTPGVREEDRFMSESIQHPNGRGRWSTMRYLRTWYIPNARAKNHAAALAKFFSNLIVRTFSGGSNLTTGSVSFTARTSSISERFIHFLSLNKSFCCSFFFWISFFSASIPSACPHS